ncbi:hypothetical protein DUK53_17115 [Listeria sp. SHR_NRA_18]|uniref:hypothetical protein n=1 Tax=Listeria sp. SHR_NRA_18 TaxID=2269046 RepID=UPI000F5D554B|nr:hypothetical protein [Listeria sp. SHR_NRA_18]RQW65308.1 hypothetical protein DUK53_17115 [Listeria sp. SHR_NRA_18]
MKKADKWIAIESIAFVQKLTALQKEALQKLTCTELEKMYVSIFETNTKGDEKNEKKVGRGNVYCSKCGTRWRNGIMVFPTERTGTRRIKIRSAERNAN